MAAILTSQGFSLVHRLPSTAKLEDLLKFQFLFGSGMGLIGILRTYPVLISTSIGAAMGKRSCPFAAFKVW